MESMYETLLGLPLFAGVSRQKMSEIIGKNKFHFLKYSQGERIVKAGEACTYIKSVIAGSVKMTTESHDHTFKIIQTLHAPDMISPDFFFGKTTHYPATVEAIGNVGILQFDKSDFMNIIISDPIFMFNYLNLLSMNAQLSVDGVLSMATGVLEKRIAYWIIALTQTNGKDITLQCRQHSMHTAFGVSRQEFDSALSRMAEADIVDITSPQEIKVTDRRLLVSLLYQ